MNSIFSGAGATQLEIVIERRLQEQDALIQEAIDKADAALAGSGAPGGDIPSITQDEIDDLVR